MSNSNFWWLVALIIGNDSIRPDERIWWVVAAVVLALGTGVVEMWRGK